MMDGFQRLDQRCFETNEPAIEKHTTLALRKSWRQRCQSLSQHCLLACSHSAIMDSAQDGRIRHSWWGGWLLLQPASQCAILQVS